MSDGPLADQGFFLMFIKRDEADSKGTLKTRTFGTQMSLMHILSAFESAMKDILGEKGGSRSGPIGIA